MKNPNSPFRVTLRVAAYSSMLSLALAAYLFCTSTTPQQYVMTAIVLVLLLFLSVAVGFYAGLSVMYRREQAQDQQVQSTIHYPARDLFNRQMDAVDARVHRLYKKDGRYA